MICPQCGNENPPKLKFCVNCGMNLENPQEVNYEQVDMGGYHTEEEPNAGGFKFGSGTFTISDKAPTDSSSDLYTADELNSDEQEFDFSSFDEPFIPKLDTERVTLPHSAQPNPQNAPMQGMYGGYPQPMMNQPQMTGMPQMNGMPQMSQVGGIPQSGAQPQMNGAQPQIIGYDQNGMPIYGQPQPMMYAQPQIIGYDQNGMPVYGQAQPMMYAQPQIIGYDQNGMPIYGQAQPMMYAQPQIIGYDQNGMPIYGQAQPMMYAQPQMLNENGEPVPAPYPQPMPYGGIAPVQPAGMPPYGAPAPQPQQPQQPQQDKERVDVPDDFWEFFDGGKSTKHAEDTMDDFFGKHSNDMGGVSANGGDMGRLKKFEKKRVDYMGDTPLVDASKLIPNTANKFNKMYMRKTDSVNAEDLEAKVQTKTQDIMRVTKEVDANKLNSYEHIKSRVTMNAAGEANADDLEAYVHEHKEAIMSQNVEAVEALPKKKSTYNDEIDAIELPDYMQARKTVKDDEPEIPGLPEI